MNFNEHSNFKGMHSFLSPSQHSWVNYDEDKLRDRYTTVQAAQRGTELHDYAERAIRLGIRQARSKATLNQYINDAIGYRMTPEQPLVYSLNCFGTADALAFSKNLLRIHDLKTGTTKVDGVQLYIYAALFCLEYGFKPFEIDYDLRIYQNDEIIMLESDPGQIAVLMDKIVQFDKIIEDMKEAY